MQRSSYPLTLSRFDLTSEEQIITIIIVIIQRPTPVSQVKLKQSETVRGLQCSQETYSTLASVLAANAWH